MLPEVYANRHHEEITNKKGTRTMKETGPETYYLCTVIYERTNFLIIGASLSHIFYEK